MSGSNGNGHKPGALVKAGRLAKLAVPEWKPDAKDEAILAAKIRLYVEEKNESYANIGHLVGMSDEGVRLRCAKPEFLEWCAPQYEHQRKLIDIRKAFGWAFALDKWIKRSATDFKVFQGLYPVMLGQSASPLGAQMSVGSPIYQTPVLIRMDGPTVVTLPAPTVPDGNGHR